MRGLWKTGGAQAALWGLVAALALVAVAASAGEAAAPAEPAVAPTDQERDADRQPNAVVLEAPRDGRWSDLRPRFEGHGLRVHIDPQTGTPVVPPEKARVRLTLPQAFSRSHEGLEVVALPNGFRYVEVRGRLMSTLAATVDESGEVQLRHRFTASTAEGWDPAPVEPERGETENAKAGEDRP